MIKFIIFLTFVVSALFLFTPSASADSILLYDDFNDGNANGWEEQLGLGGSWKVENGEYVGRVERNSWGWATRAIAGDINWTNYIIELRVKGTAGVDKKVKFRYKEHGGYYELNLRSGFNDLAVGKVYSKGWLKFEPVENLLGVWYAIKVVLKGPNIKIFINNEPIFDFVDDEQPILNGRIALEVWPGGAEPVTINHFDDVKVTSLDSTEDFLPVPYFSQRDPLWKADEYDHASKWVEPGEENTIEWWGCALTSGAMVTRYFGVDKTPYNEELTPGTLNKWMQDQNDANFRNGAMNWQLLSRMSAKTASLFGTPKLDLSLSKMANNFSKLDEILLQSLEGFPGLPGVLQVAHPTSPNGKHFVVAKGRSGITYGLNDPYDQNKNLLSASPYNNNFGQLVWYEPTHSNLSTIFLVVDKNVDIKILYQNSFIGEQFDLYPLGADGGNSGESGEVLKMLYLDKPTSGNYSIALSTANPQPQSYRLDVYLYDRNAEVKMATFVGWVGPGDQDNIFINFDLENVQNSHVSRPVTFATLRDDINLSYLFGWIDNDGIKDSLLAKVNSAEKASQREDKKTGENILNALLNEIEAQKGKQLNPLAYHLLKGDIEILLS